MLKFTIKKEEIIDVLAKIQGITGRPSALAINGCVMIRSADNGVELYATDLETDFMGFYSAEVQSEGTIAINSKKFFEIVKEHPDEDILVTEKENYRIEIGNNKIEYCLIGLDPDELPDAVDLNEVTFFNLDSAKFKNMIEKVLIIGVGDDRIHHYLAGVYLEKAELDGQKVLRMISTDGGRLMKVDYIFDDTLPDIEGSLIPKKSLAEVNKFISNKGEVSIGVKENVVILKKDNETITIRLLEGDFPKYDSIIEKTPEHKAMIIDRIGLYKMFRRMLILCASGKGSEFDISKERLFVTSKNPEMGESKEDIAVEFNGDPLKIFFNLKFFIEVLNILEQEKIQISLLDSEKPCIIEGYGESEDNFLCLIMPMRND